MSDDETPTPEPAEAAAEQPAAEAAVATIEESVPPAELEHASAPAEVPTFRSKFLLPLVVPVAVAAAIIFFVLNISRVFLASQNSLAVTWASVITLAILVGGSALAASPKLRSSSLTLIMGGGFLVLLMGGLISIGAASPKGEAGPVQCTPVASNITVDAGAGGALKFSFPKGNTVKAGCVDISLAILSSSHTLLFDAPPAADTFPELNVSEKSWAGTLAAGEYAFHCTIPGHESMKADLVVTG